MAGRKKEGSEFDISALFEQELKARNEDLRRQGALSMLPKLRPAALVTMAEFFDSLQQHREVWSAVLEMPAVEFGALIAENYPLYTSKNSFQPRPKRSRSRSISVVFGTVNSPYRTAFTMSRPFS